MTTYSPLSSLGGPRDHLDRLVADILDDVLAVGAIDAKHLSGIVFILQLLQNLCINCSTKLNFPAGASFDHQTRQRDTDDNQELLMNVEH